MFRKIFKIVAGTLGGIILLLLIYGAIQYPKAKGEQHFTAERIIKAPKEKVWELIADVGNYHKVTAPGIHAVEILEGEGLGMKRECSDPNGNSWEETCTLWDDGNAYKFEVNTQREDYPFPLRSLSGLWKLEAISDTETKLLLDFSYEFSNPFLSGYFLSMGMEQARKDTEFLLDNWQRMAENNKDSL